MNDWLLTLLRMSAAGALTILAVLLTRLVLRRFPRKYVCLLWLAVLFRLLCPVTLPSPTSVIPETVESGELVTSWTESYAEETRVIRRGEPGYKAALDAGRIPVESGASDSRPTAAEAPPEPDGSEAPPVSPQSRPAARSYVVTAADGLSEPKRAGEVWLPVLAWVWLAGAAALLLWSAVRYLRLRIRLREAVKLEDRVYEAEGLDSPFVLGILRPRIYLPWGMEKEERTWVLLHERAHIRRLDPLWKLLGWLALCLHWFDPLCWLAFSLAMQDMEGACDEAVVRALDGEERAAYSRLLLALSGGRPLFAATPLGFGEGNVKQRIKSVLRWQRPKRWMAALAVLLLAAVVLLFALGPGKDRKAFPEMEDTPDTWTQMRFFRQEWTDLAAGQRGVWPVEDVKGFKKELKELLKEGQWQLGGVCGTPEVDWKAILPGKLRWVSGGAQWQLYTGPHSLALTRDGDYVWYGSAVKETDSPDKLYDVDGERMEAVLALTEWGQPVLTLEPEADLCFAALPWGCSIKDAQAALPGLARTGPLTLKAKDASLCGYRVDAVLEFERDDAGTFLNRITLSFTEEPEAMDLQRFDLSVLGGELSETWGERHADLPDRFHRSTDPSYLPERILYWYTEDFSDERRWMSGVVGWYERKDNPRVLNLDASGRNLAAGRQFTVREDAITEKEIAYLGEVLRHELTGGCETVGVDGHGGVYLRITDPEDRAWLKEMLAPWPWVYVVLADSAAEPAPPSPQPHYPVEEGWTLLTEEEIEEAREALEPIRFLEDGSTWVNPVDPCFTSFYTDPRELNFSAFMRYFGIGDPTVTEPTEEDFRALRDYGYDFWGSPWRHAEDIETPRKRIPASTVEAALRLYYDIGLSDLKADYRTRYYYLPQTDCFYSRTSDFGPGAFQPDWGERKDDLVRLWHSKTCLTCRKLEDRWIILSFWNENAAGNPEHPDEETWPPEARTRYGIAPEYQWVFVPEDIVYELEDGTTLTVPAGWRYRVEWEQVTPEGELWLRSEAEAWNDLAIQMILLRPEDVIPWTEELAPRTLCPVTIPAGTTYYPKSFRKGEGEDKTLAECLTEENASAHGYDMTGAILALEEGYALVGFSGGTEVWVKRDGLSVGKPGEKDSEPLMMEAARRKAEELGYPLETWGAELVWHRGREKTEESAYYAAYFPTSSGEGTVCVIFAGSFETGFTPSEALLIPPGAADWP